ncbi:AsnC family protein, partial [Amycolatopsis sp. NPDC000746]|uniref:AsnC family protein n=1 Tax=Amycolatopsis sp. NPDC000746 TaxID=3154270 RepID=UPI003328580B
MSGPLEPLDQSIVQELAADGRRSFTDLAERVGLSAAEYPIQLIRSRPSSVRSRSRSRTFWKVLISS